MRNLFLLLVGGAVVLEAIADVLFKRWSLENRPFLLLLGLAIYFIGTVAWAYSLKHEQLSKAIIVFTVLNVILVLIAGIVLFDEQLSFANKVGVLLGIVSVVLVQL